MNLVQLKPEDIWKSSAGLCMLCGTPLGLELRGKQMKENLFSEEEEEVLSANMMMMMNRDEDLQENFVRVGLFKYNLLGHMHSCHIIDQYTFLKGQDMFMKALKENEKVISALGGNLYKDMPAIYDKASDYCYRVAAKIMVPGCKPCNDTMNRSGLHADVVYRCFQPSSQLNIPELEDGTTRTGHVISKGITVKKLIQQIALFFRPPLTKEDKWHARDDSEIMSLATLWRCVAYLCIWGKVPSARFRVISIFYASVYIYEKLNLRDLMGFNDWHMHVFRMHYMNTYAKGFYLPFCFVFLWWWWWLLLSQPTYV